VSALSFMYSMNFSEAAAPSIKRVVKLKEYGQRQSAVQLLIESSYHAAKYRRKQCVHVEAAVLGASATLRATCSQQMHSDIILSECYAACPHAFG
jgi:hypothetical protein